MARPKEKTGISSSSFHDKYEKERVKLETRMSKILQSDMLGLLEGELFSDITLVTQDQEIKVHKCILQLRTPNLLRGSLNSETDNKINLKDFNHSELYDIIVEMYTKDDFSKAAKLKIEKFFTNKTNGGGICCTDKQEKEFSNGDILETQVNVTESNGLDHDDNNQNRMSTDISVEEKKSQEMCNIENKPMSSLAAENGLNENGCVKEDVIDSGKIDMEYDSKLNSRTSKTTPKEIQACNKLGVEFLRLYDSQKGTDVILRAGGVNFEAHKCILCARSTYFAAMLGGSWRESGTETIDLVGVIPSVLEQALQYIYGGMIELSGDCPLGELVKLSDMYGIEGLKDVITFVLTWQYCHFFHKPCTGCLTGVAETLPLAYTFGWQELFDKCTKWSIKHFVRMWPQKTFAMLPQEVQDASLEGIVNELTVDSVIDTVINCDTLVGSLVQMRWTQPVFALASRLKEGCISYIGNNMAVMVKSAKFKAYGNNMVLGLDLLEDIFSKALKSMPKENACKAYVALDMEKERTQREDCTWNKDFKLLIEKLYKKCEDFIYLYFNQIYNTDEWQSMPICIQKSLKEGTSYVCVQDEKRRRAPPKLSSSTRPRIQRPSSTDDILNNNFHSAPPSARSSMSMDAVRPDKMSSTNGKKGPTQAQGPKSGPKKSYSQTKAQAIHVKTQKQTAKNDHHGGQGDKPTSQPKGKSNLQKQTEQKTQETDKERKSTPSPVMPRVTQQRPKVIPGNEKTQQQQKKNTKPRPAGYGNFANSRAMSWTDKRASITSSVQSSLMSLNGGSENDLFTVSQSDELLSQCSHMAIRGSISTPCELSPTGSEHGSEGESDNSDVFCQEDYHGQSVDMFIGYAPPQIFLVSFEKDLLIKYNQGDG